MQRPASLPYLEELMARLAVGVAQLPDEQRARHATWLRGKQRADGGFAGREGDSDLYYTSFGLRGLALLGELTGEPAQRAAGFLRASLTGRAPIVDFLSLIYSDALLGSAAGIEVLADQSSGWQRQVAACLEEYRRADGGYAKGPEGQASSTYHSFLVLLCQQLIAVPVVEPERLAAFLLGQRRDDGGFVEIGPMRRSGTNPTAAAVGALKILGHLTDEVREATIDFLLDMQTDEGGLRANTRIPVADLLSTFTGLLTLADLEAMDQLDLPAVRNYVLALEHPRGGFHAAVWDLASDVEYSFYGLAALGLLAGTTAAATGGG